MKYFIFPAAAMYLLFMISCGAGSDPAHINEGEANHTHEGEAIHTHEVFPHTVMSLKKTKFSPVIKTSGQILVDQKDIIDITAKSPGIARFINDYLFTGVSVNKGDILFTVSGESLTEENTEVNFAQIQSDYNAAKENFDRASQLIGDKLITQSAYIDARNNFERTEAEYKNYKSTVSGNAGTVRSPAKGYIKEIYITEGQKIESGEKLASLIIEHNLILKVDLPPDMAEFLKNVDQANFSTGYSEKVYKTGEMNGKLISWGKSTGESSYYIPIYFRFDYTKELISGTFADVWLLGHEQEDALTVPNSAIMEEFGKFYVFTEDDDGDFIKEYFTPGRTDGINTEVLAGLHEGDMVVTTGTYQVKMSQMGSNIPDAHAGHSH